MKQEAAANAVQAPAGGNSTAEDQYSLPDDGGTDENKSPDATTKPQEEKEEVKASNFTDKKEANCCEDTRSKNEDEITDSEADGQEEHNNNDDDDDSIDKEIKDEDNDVGENEEEEEENEGEAAEDKN